MTNLWKNQRMKIKLKIDDDLHKQYIKRTIVTEISTQEVKQLAKEAYIYAFPMQMGYRLIGALI
jgi:hypothetical protein